MLAQLNGHCIEIKSHMVKIVITWSISPDENNNIELVYKTPHNNTDLEITQSCNSQKFLTLNFRKELKEIDHFMVIFL